MIEQNVKMKILRRTTSQFCIPNAFYGGIKKVGAQKGKKQEKKKEKGNSSRDNKQIRYVDKKMETDKGNHKNHHVSTQEKEKTDNENENEDGNEGLKKENGHAGCVGGS